MAMFGRNEVRKLEVSKEKARLAGASVQFIARRKTIESSTSLTVKCIDARK
jgi:hypothetical protein